MSTHPVPFVTPEQYLEFDRRSDVRNEYIFGEIVPILDATMSHGRLLTKIGGAFDSRLLGGPCQVFTGSPRLCLDAGSVFAYPDVTIVCGRPEFFEQEEETILNPKVLVEVLSPSTRNYDLGDKARMYRRLSSVSELVMIEQNQVAIQHQSRLPNGSWVIEELEGRQVTLVLASLGIEIPLAEIYAGTEPI